MEACDDDDDDGVIQKITLYHCFQETKKVALAMHCQLRPLNPLWFLALTRYIMHEPTSFRQNWAIMAELLTVQQILPAYSSSAGASLNDPLPNYNNWPSIFCRPFLMVTLLTEQQPSYICTLPENFYPT